MAEAIGERDGDLLADLQAAGYTHDTIVLVEITPQVQIAWADGRVSQPERNVIFEATADRAVAIHSWPHRQLTQWLDHRPSEDFFRVSRRVITRMLLRLPARLRSNVRRSLVRECVAIARASGGLLGWGSVSAEEQQVIDSFEAELDTRIS
jgi:hypothetical protein